MKRRTLLLLAVAASALFVGAYAFTSLLVSTSVNVSANAYISSVSVTGGTCTVSPDGTSASCSVSGYEGDSLVESVVVAVHNPSVSQVKATASSSDPAVASVSPAHQQSAISLSSPASFEFDISLISAGSAVVAVSIVPSGGA